MFSSQSSPQVSSRSEISLGEQIQQKSRQNSPDKNYYDGGSDSNLYLRQQCLENTAVGEMDSNCLGDTLMIGSISKVFEKDNNLSRRVHELFESDESTDGNSDRLRANFDNNESTLLSFQQLLPNEHDFSISSKNNQNDGLVSDYSEDPNIGASRIFTRLKPIGVTEATPFKLKSTQNAGLSFKFNQFPSEISYSQDPNTDASKVFTRLKPDGITEATPFKPKPSAQDDGYSFKPNHFPSGISYSGEMSFGNISSLNNTEYGDLPYFNDLSNNGNKSISSPDFLVDKNQTEKFDNEKKDSSSEHDNIVPTASDSIFDYQYLNQFQFLSNNNNNQSTKIENEVQKLVHETNEFSKAVNKQLFNENNNNKKEENTSDRSSVENLENFFLGKNNLSTNEQTNKRNEMKSILDEDCIKLFDPLISGGKNFDISQAISNDSLAIQVKNLLDVTEGSDQGSFENHKLLHDQIELEKNKSLNYSNVLSEFENTELWGYVQKFIPSNNNESLKKDEEFVGANSQRQSLKAGFSKNQSILDGSFNQSLKFDNTKTPVITPIKKSLATSDCVQNSHKQIISQKDSCEAYSINKQTSTKIFSESSGNMDSKSSFSMDFDGYVQKTCDKYLNHEKAKKSNNFTVDSTQFSSSSNLFSRLSDTHSECLNKNQSLSRIVEENGYGDIRPTSIIEKAAREPVSENISKETKNILNDLIHAEDSLRKSLGKSYQYRQLSGSKMPSIQETRIDQFSSKSVNDIAELEDSNCKGDIQNKTEQVSRTEERPRIEKLQQQEINKIPDKSTMEEGTVRNDTTETKSTELVTSHSNIEDFQKFLTRQVQESGSHEQKVINQGDNIAVVKDGQIQKEIPTNKNAKSKNGNIKSVKNFLKVQEQITTTERIPEHRHLPTYEEMLQKLSVFEVSGSKEQIKSVTSINDHGAGDLGKEKKNDEEYTNNVEAENLQTEKPPAKTEKLEKCVGTEDMVVEKQVEKIINKQERYKTIEEVFMSAPTTISSSSSATTDLKLNQQTSNKQQCLFVRNLPQQLSVIHSTSSVRSMIAQCDEKSSIHQITVTPTVDFQNQPAPLRLQPPSSMLPWLPNSLEEFKSLDDYKQADIVKKILKVFDQGDPTCFESPRKKHKPRSHVPRESRPEIESYFAAKYADAYRGTTDHKYSSRTVVQTNDYQATPQQTVQRLLNKIQRQRTSKKSDVSNFYDEDYGNGFIKSKHQRTTNESEKMFYVKLSSNELKALMESKTSSKKQHEYRNNEKKTKYIEVQSSRVFHTSSPIRKKSFKDMKRKEEVVHLKNVKL